MAVKLGRISHGVLPLMHKDEPGLKASAFKIGRPGKGSGEFVVH